MVGKRYHNHTDKSYTIHVIKTGWLITRNGKHMKPRQIAAKQYIHNQLDEHIVRDALEDIQNQIEKQKPMNHTYTHKELFKTIKMEVT